MRKKYFVLNGKPLTDLYLPLNGCISAVLHIENFYLIQKSFATVNSFCSDIILCFIFVVLYFCFIFCCLLLIW